MADSVDDRRFTIRARSRPPNHRLRTDPDVRDPPPTTSSGYGHRTGPLPEVLLLQIVCPIPDGNHSHGLRHTRIQDRGSATKNTRRDQRVRPYKADATQEASLSFLILVINALNIYPLIQTMNVLVGN